MDAADLPFLAGAVVLLFAIVYLAARNEVVRKKLVCPRSGAVADVDVVRRFEKPEREVRVKSCSRFADPRRVECAGECLER
jgi:hypothetical protein